MLILMRRPGESIHIGSNIVVTLVSMERNRARIGIQAPRDITVDREEIAEKKKDGQAAAQLKSKGADDALSAAEHVLLELETDVESEESVDEEDSRPAQEPVKWTRRR